MKKLVFYRIVSIVLLLATVILAVFCFRLSAEKKDMMEQEASDNLRNWQEIMLMTRKIQTGVKSLDEIKDYAFYQNTILYTISDRLQPAFNGGKVGFRFLPTTYDPLLQSLASASENEKIDRDLLEDGFELYLAANADLKAACDFVISSVEKNPDLKYDLLRSDSRFSKEVQDLTREFCDKYEPKIEYFHKQLNQQEQLPDEF